MSEPEHYRQIVEELSKIYSKCFNIYTAILLIGIAILGILAIWILLENEKDKHLR